MSRWNLFKKIKKPKTKVTDEEIEKAKKMIDAVLYPQIKKQISLLNKHLEEDKIQVGVEINWFFQKTE